MYEYANVDVTKTDMYEYIVGTCTTTGNPLSV